jgi:hypothetical protein
MLDTVGKIITILLIRILREVKKRWFLRDEKFSFRPRHNMMVQLNGIVLGVTRNFDVNRIRRSFPVYC